MNRDISINPHPGSPSPDTVSADGGNADDVTSANKAAGEEFNAGPAPEAGGEATDEVTKANEDAAAEFRDGKPGNLTGNRVGGFRGSSD